MISFIKSSFLLIIWTVLSRISGFVRDSIMAKYLGASVFSDALFAASKLPNSFRRLLAEGAMSSVFVPIFAKDLESNKKDEAMIFANQIFTVLLIALIIIVLIFELFMPFWIKLLSPGFVSNKEKFDLTVGLARINFLFLITISLSAFCGGMLNSVYKFAYFAATPIILNICIVIVSVYFQHNENLVYYISHGTVVAGLVTLVSLMYVCYKNGMIVKLSKITWNTKIKSFFSKMLNGLIGSGVYQVNIFVDTFFASWFAGGASYLYYTDRINQLPITLIGGTFGIALLPTVSRLISNRKMNEARELRQNCVLFGFFTSVLCVISIVALGNEITTFIYERGEFVHEDVLVVTKMLTIFIFGLFFSVLSKIYNAFLFASGDTRSPMINGMICTLVNIIANCALYKTQGVYCIAYATLISSIFGGLISMYHVDKWSILKFNWILIHKMMYITVIGLITIMLQLFLMQYFKQITGMQSISLLLTLGFSTLVYCAMAIIIRVYTLNDLLKVFKKMHD